MFWSKKEEKKSLPDLPPLRPSFALHLESDESEESEEKQPLPSFPDSANKKGFSQAAIKEAVSPSREELPKIPISGEEPEEEEEMEETLPKIREMEPFIPKIRAIELPSRALATKAEDVYVKIDRFHSARKSLTEAKAKLADMEDLLKKIRETRVREEQELSSWEKEVDSVKLKVEDITKNIFEKVE